MIRSPRFFVAFAGLITIVLLTWGIFFRGGSENPPVQTFATPAEELEFFLADKMDYSITFSRILAERRITRAHELGAADPALAGKAALVADSLKARLERAKR